MQGLRPGLLLSCTGVFPCFLLWRPALSVGLAFPLSQLLLLPGFFFRSTKNKKL
ncbi:hypothetical protein 2011_scaffold13_00001 [Bacteriophage sp.]|nr:hypothetical protein 2011_scaffold13_00001 [Bacteriophage sp.]